MGFVVYSTLQMRVWRAEIEQREALYRNKNEIMQTIMVWNKEQAHCLLPLVYAYVFLKY